MASKKKIEIRDKAGDLLGHKWEIRWREKPSPECPSGERTQTEYDEDTADTVHAEAVVIEAQLKLEARKRGVTRERLADRSKTYKDVADQWLGSFTRKNTRLANEVRMRVHIYPIIGDRPIAEILPSELLATVRSWSRLAKSTQVANWRSMAAVFNWAVSERILAADENPAKATSIKRGIPRLAKGETPDAWDKDWVRNLYAAIRPDCSIFVLLGAWCGLRQGEIFGLSLDDFDFNDKGNRIVKARRQVLVDPSNSLYFGPPKHRHHEDAAREVEVPDFVWEAIEDHMIDYPPRNVTLDFDRGDGSNPKEITVKLLMTTRESGAFNRNYFNTFIWKPALTKCGIPTIRVNGTHALRHWFAVDFMYNGGTLAALSEALGHFDKTFTLTKYQRFDRRGVAEVTSARNTAGRQLLRRDASEPDGERSPSQPVPAASTRSPGRSKSR